jgi:hypothetical protein
VCNPYLCTGSKYDDYRLFFENEGSADRYWPSDIYRNGLGVACVNALESQLPDDQREQGQEKFKRDELARKVFGQKSVALTVEQVASIKDRIGRAYGPVVVGAAWRILDPAVSSH